MVDVFSGFLNCPWPLLPAPHFPQLQLSINSIDSATTSPRYISLPQTAQKTSKSLFHYCMFSYCQGNNMSTELFPSNGCCTVTHLHNCYLAMGLHVTIYIYIYIL
jgi:hypothetical protein